MNENGTHVVGTLRKNLRNNPPNVLNAKLKKGKIVAQKTIKML